MAAAPFEEAIERRGIGESGRLRDRSVFALFVAVGGEGVEIEGDDRSSRRLRAPDAFDRGVQPRDRAALAGNEAGGFLLFALSAEPSPQRSRRRSVVDANVFQSLAFQREDDVLILHLLRPAEAGKIGRRPGIEEAQQGLQVRDHWSPQALFGAAVGMPQVE